MLLKYSVNFAHIRITANDMYIYIFFYFYRSMEHPPQPGIVEFSKAKNKLASVILDFRFVLGKQQISFLNRTENRRRPLFECDSSGKQRVAPVKKKKETLCDQPCADGRCFLKHLCR